MSSGLLKFYEEKARKRNYLRSLFIWMISLLTWDKVLGSAGEGV